MGELHTTNYELMQDEAGLREYIASFIGEQDDDLLADFAWKASSAEEDRTRSYLTHLANIARNIAEKGIGEILPILEEARKPTIVHAQQAVLADYSQQLVTSIIKEIGSYPLEKRAKATTKCWRILLRRMRKKLSDLYPHAKPEVIDRAIEAGCVWDKSEESFGVEPSKLVEAMRTSPSD